MRAEATRRPLRSPAHAGLGDGLNGSPEVGPWRSSPGAQLKNAADAMGVSLATARRRVKSGAWTVRRDGRRVLVDLSGLHGPSDEDIKVATAKIRDLSEGASTYTRGRKSHG